MTEPRIDPPGETHYDEPFCEHCGEAPPDDVCDACEADETQRLRSEQRRVDLQTRARCLGLTCEQDEATGDWTLTTIDTDVVYRTVEDALVSAYLDGHAVGRARVLIEMLIKLVPDTEHDVPFAVEEGRRFIGQ